MNATIVILKTLVRTKIAFITFLALALLPSPIGAFAGGSLSGTIHDASGAVIRGARVTLVNVALRTELKSVSDEQGFYSFPALSVGRYEMTMEAAGFKPQKKTNLAIDADAALRVDAVLQVGEISDEVTVSASDSKLDTQVDTISTHLGEVVTQAQLESIPLNGRSYTDLLAIQPGVSPISTLTPTSVIMAGVCWGRLATG